MDFDRLTRSAAEQLPAPKHPLRWWHLIIVAASLSVWSEYVDEAATLARHSGRYALLMFSLVGLILISPLVAIGMLVRDWLLYTADRVGFRWLAPRLAWETIVLVNFSVLLYLMSLD